MSRLKRAQMRIDDGCGHFVSAAALRQNRKKTRTKHDDENGCRRESGPPCRTNRRLRTNRSDCLHWLARCVDGARSTDRGLQIAPDFFRCALAQPGALNRGAQILLRFEFGDALRARKQMLLELRGACCVEFAVEIAVEYGVCQFTTHVGPPRSSLRRLVSAIAAIVGAPGKVLTSRCRSESTRSLSFHCRRSL